MSPLKPSGLHFQSQFFQSFPNHLLITSWGITHFKISNLQTRKELMQEFIREVEECDLIADQLQTTLQLHLNSIS